MPQSYQQQKEAQVKYDLIAGMCLYGHEAMSAVQSTAKTTKKKIQKKLKKKKNDKQTTSEFLVLA